MDTVMNVESPEPFEQLRLLDGDQYRFTLRLYSGDGELTLYQEIKGYRVPVSLTTIIPPTSFATNGHAFQVVNITPDGMKSLLKIVEGAINDLKQKALNAGLPEHAFKKRRH